jgi:hypothetical protein
MARPKKKYHYIYKTTCNLNGKYYIGMHSTSTIEDGYMGSGKKLRYSIRKHGVENFTREILEFLEDRDSLAKREAEIVNEELINDPLCMNLKHGGQGGWPNTGKAIGGDCFKAAHAYFNTDEGKLKLREIGKLGYQSQVNAGTVKTWKDNYSWLGKKHKEESKRLIGEKNSIKQKGSGNSQFGTCWITNEIENKKIKKGDLITEGWRLGRKQ